MTKSHDNVDETIEKKNSEQRKPSKVDRQHAIDQVSEFIVENKTWMLTTLGSDNVMRTRPMLNVNNSFEGTLYLFSIEPDGISEAIRSNPGINLVISEPSSGRFATLLGNAKRIDDDKKAEFLWNDRCASWFNSDQIPSDASLIEIDVASIEYWDVKQSFGSRFVNFVKSLAGFHASEKVEHETISW